jgi:hypothetical protein
MVDGELAHGGDRLADRRAEQGRDNLSDGERYQSRDYSDKRSDAGERRPAEPGLR